LSSIPFFSENFGLQLNFLHRVFIVFLLCTAIQLLMSKNYKPKDDMVYLSDPKIKFSFKLLLIFGLMNILFLLMILQSVVSSHWIALPAAVFTLLIYNGGFDFTDRVRIIGGLLSALTVWSLYRFV